MGGVWFESIEALSYILFPLHFSFHFSSYITTHYQWQFKGEGLRVCTPPPIRHMSFLPLAWCQKFVQWQNSTSLYNARSLIYYAIILSLVSLLHKKKLHFLNQSLDPFYQKFLDLLLTGISLRVIQERIPSLPFRQMIKWQYIRTALISVHYLISSKKTFVSVPVFTIHVIIIVLMHPKSVREKFK